MAHESCFKDRYGPWAFVAGGSEGIGGSIAEALAKKGLNLILVARNADKLARKKDTLEQRHGVQVRTVAFDLSESTKIPSLTAQFSDLDIGLFCHVAHASEFGVFGELDLAQQLRVVDINVRTLMMLTHWASGPMLQRRRGGILLVSSMAGLQGAPFSANYGATKAYEIVLAEGLWHECRPYGVDVLALVAGATDTENYRVQKLQAPDWYAPRIMSADEVAGEGLKQLGRKPIHIAGASNRLGAIITGRLLPRSIASKIIGIQNRRLHGMAE
mgnify:CR=1 FL=1